MLIRKIGAAVGALALVASFNANAIVAFAGDNTYIGEFDPTLFEGETFEHNPVCVPTGPACGTYGAIDDYWIFSVDPAGNGRISADFVSVPGNLSDWTGSLFLFTPDDPNSAVVGSVLAGTLGAQIGGDWTGATGFDSGNLALGAAGQFFAIRIQANVPATGVSVADYTGQVRTFVVETPEPGSLALLGLGLLGIGAARRRIR